MRRKNIYAPILILFLLLLPGISYAQDYEADNKKGDIEEITPETVNKLRPGMELRKIGGINMVVPEGTQVYKQGAMLIMEEDGDYSARRFKIMDERFNKLDERLQKIEAEIAELRNLLNKAKKE